ncbi:MAG: helix-turn-helix domain-containing protein [Defluviitaleaceae bacterium]|nr:helix-turn-helix domain-containing protein [Defluviitaleaceae bacterium]
MLSNQILQSTVEGLSGITRRGIRVVERDGRPIVGEYMDEDGFDPAHAVEAFVYSLAETQMLQGFQYFKVFDNGIAEYVVILKGDDEDTYQIGRMAAFHIQTLLVAYKERFDRDNFIKNLLMDNLLLVDIYNRAKKLQVENDVRRVVYLIELDMDKDMTALEVVRNIFPAKQKDFVTAIDEKHIVLVKELRDKERTEDIERYAHTISDTLAAEAMSSGQVAIGTAVTDLKHVSASFKEAKMALEVGKIFETDKNVINYESLGIGRLIYQLPLSICRMFLGEVLQGSSVDSFDDETLATVNKFFENHLNVSETSRQLYIHRNTLVYRLDKLQKQTGLDLRNFEDAIIFKITLMVSKYLNYKERFMS